ncbi:MAG TPA: DUF1538 domain-containing protein [Chitinivibrionales bacterium]|nr:DUF1538 domain-containing protein [Chitinivibrionales bacterium]
MSLSVDAISNDYEPAAPKKIHVTFSQAMTILLPYSWHQIREQLVTVAPVCLYLVLFQLLFLRYGLTQVGWITGGVVMVIFGLVFFLEGVRIGLVPIGEAVGDTLPVKSGLFAVLAFAFVLGILAAFGEPVLGSLQIAGAGVDPARAPLLYYLLVKNPLVLTLTVSLGSGVAVLLGTLRFIYGWGLKSLILPCVGIAIALTLFAAQNHLLASAAGLAWDTGAVIVGPVLCPLVLALGLGVSRATGKSDPGMAGFGMVGLISVVPIAAVLLLAYILQLVFGAGHFDIAPVTISQAAAGLYKTLFDSFVLALRAVLPIFIFLYLFLRLKLKEEGVPLPQLILGLTFAITGLFLFNFGLAVGLSELGNQVGNRLPLSFHPPSAALYPTAVGKLVVVAFGGILGYGATLAEPAFKILGRQVEDVTQGAFKKWLFSQAVALGVGAGASLGIVSIVYEVNLLFLLIPPYALLFFLTLYSSEKYVAIAWDGGAVTTGPVTVPLKIAIGIALSHATGFAEGFGILALASAYPVLNILLIGLYAKQREQKLEIKLLQTTEAAN